MSNYLIFNLTSLKMRILVTGVVVFVIWCFISAWLYNDKLLPAIKNRVAVQVIPESQTNEADSLMKLKASLPSTLSIYFEFDKAKFKPDPQNSKSIAEIKSWLDKNPGSKLYITGYSDLVGTPDYNHALGQRRAEVVQKYILSQGIDGARIITESKGEDQPAADYLTDEGRAKNRRTEVLIKF